MPRNPANKRPNLLEHQANMLEPRWLDPSHKLIEVSRAGPVWLKAKGFANVIKYTEALKPTDVDRLSIEKWASVLHTDALSRREYQIFQRLAVGETVSEISKALYLSPKTVSTYRTRIIEKTGLRNNAEMAVYAMQCGVVTWTERKPQENATNCSAAA